MTRNLIRLCFLASFFLMACAQKIKQLAEIHLPNSKEKELIHALDSISLRKPDFFYSKLDTKFSDGEKNILFKTSARLKSDSALNVIFSFAKIPVAIAMVTTDSLTIVNMRDKCYVLENLAYFQTNFGVAFSYKTIEELLLGLPVGYDIEQEYYQLDHPSEYILSSHPQGEASSADSEQNSRRINYFLSQDLKTLKRIELIDPQDSTIILVDYLIREEVFGFFLPKFVIVEIRTSTKTLRLELEYDKIEVNEPKELVIVIPESYEVCN